MSTSDFFSVPQVVDTANNARRIKELLTRIEYKEGWTFDIYSSLSIYVFRIRVNTTDPHLSGRGKTVGILIDHQFPIPPYPMTDDTILRWILDNIVLVEQHEACEFFKFDGVASFMPDHSPTGDPYRIPTELRRF